MGPKKPFAPLPAGKRPSVCPWSFLTTQLPFTYTSPLLPLFFFSPRPTIPALYPLTSAPSPSQLQLFTSSLPLPFFFPTILVLSLPFFYQPFPPPPPNERSDTTPPSLPPLFPYPHNSLCVFFRFLYSHVGMFPTPSPHMIGQSGSRSLISPPFFELGLKHFIPSFFLFCLIFFPRVIHFFLFPPGSLPCTGISLRLLRKAKKSH